ncbi:undecaprenyl-diphosphate phosphatase [Gracilinema caldarium]|uniref:undecaprenyl-diphosphate phosphatase n=1 Tax=Gracilinema caldarium TaxID=215591 RepID=UPI0026EC2F8F|nr:undecaprenyl-diphosphate phosphatase [Gracilinema caldarium]
MSILQAIFLGFLQGLTEFLPVSSSGHLVLAQKIMGISEPALFFDTLLHVGTLVAVLIVLWKDVWALMRRPFQRLTGLIILGTLPTIVIALVFKDAIEHAFTSGAFLGIGFLLTTGLLLGAEYLSSRKTAGRGETEMKYTDALLIGTLQGVAIFPAVSRSGSTIAGALGVGLNREFAARFSFLMAIPAILGAFVLQLKDLLPALKAHDTETIFGGIGLPAIIAGTVTATVVGIFAVRFMLNLIKNKNLKGFALYTAVLGVLVLADQALFHLFFK